MANAQVMISALADPTRRLLIQALRSGPLSVGQLTARTPVTRSAVSQHLQVLKAAELVEERRDGTRHYYNLHPAALGELRRYVDALWTDALTSYSNKGDI